MKRTIRDVIKFIAEDKQTDINAFKQDVLALCLEIEHGIGMVVLNERKQERIFERD